LLSAIQLWAAPVFPELAGRVVDHAGLLSRAEERQLSALLAQLENETTDQVVVVTLKSLQGYDIADYGYQLGRHWGIGHKDSDNGVLLIIAPTERKVRIEVGYGLEETLTDKIAHDIIAETILPHFKEGHYAAGILTGAEAIVQALHGNFAVEEYNEEENVSSEESALPVFAFFALLLFASFFAAGRFILRFFLSVFFALFSGTIVGIVSGLPILGLVGGLVAFIIGMRVKAGGDGGSSSGNSYSSSYSSSSFSSGGGSFGGGGASGSW
jgi:uncharacterized protein